jgi:hypothetical protein
MFSLIITLISIALVAALALATLYYGGSSWTRGAAGANAAMLANQGQQLLAALTLYYTEHSAYPATLDELVTGEYLKTVPVPPASLAAAPSLVAPALAAGEAWTMLAAGQPAAMVRDAVAQDVCQEVNYRVLGSDAVHEKADPTLMAQCYGPAGGPFTFVVGVPADDGATASLARAFEHYNAAHAGAPLPVVTPAAPANPVTVAATRGAPVAQTVVPPGVSLTLGSVAPLASVATGNGGALMRAQVSLDVGTASVSLTLERTVSSANLAQVASAATWSAGPGVLPGLSLDSMSWSGTAWTVPDPNSPYVSPETGINEYTGCAKIGQVGGYGLGTRLYTGKPGVFRILAYTTTGPVGWVAVNNCTNLPASAGFFPRLYFQQDGTPPAPSTLAASSGQVQTAVLAALAANPAQAGAVLDASLAMPAGAAQLQADPLAVSGPATVSDGATTYALSYLDGVVTVAGTETATVTVAWP